MPSTHPAFPPMTQVSIGDPNRSLRGIPSPDIHQSLYTVGEHPPRAHFQSQAHTHSRNSSNEPLHFIRSPGSVSSDGTGSSSPSTYKPHLSCTSAQRYHLSSHAEAGSMGDIAESTNGYSGTHTGSRQEMSPRQQSVMGDNAAVHLHIREDGHEDEDDHAIWILLWLSFLDPLFTFFCATSTIIVALFLLLVSPIRFCKPSCSISILIIRTLAPLFRNHLRLICAPSVEDAHTFDFKPAMLVLIHIVSPVLSIGVAVAAWISAAFWLFALIMGNPDGTERRDDGRAAVLTVRDWWEKLLLNAVR